MIATIILVSVLVLSIILHELAHGYAANWLGDPTARLAGRLTLNPIHHIDPLGSIIIPGLLFFSGAGFLFGWAKQFLITPTTFVIDDGDRHLLLQQDPLHTSFWLSFLRF